MARQQSHRGSASRGDELFGARRFPAVHDLCWLLDRGYASNSSMELVGNRHNLTERQRMDEVFGLERGVHAASTWRIFRDILRVDSRESESFPTNLAPWMFLTLLAGGLLHSK